MFFTFVVVRIDHLPRDWTVLLYFKELCPSVIISCWGKGLIILKALAAANVALVASSWMLQMSLLVTGFFPLISPPNLLLLL